MTDQIMASTPDDGDDIAARLAELLAEARSRGVDVSGAMTAAQGLSLREQLDLRLPVLRRDHKGTHGTWALYLRRLADGLPDLCPCVCLPCAQGTCPCTAGTHAEGCSPEADVNCADRMRAHGEDSVRDISRHHVADAAWWARRHAMQRTVVRNAKREAAGRVLHDHDGRGAQEAMVQACRWLWNEMRRDGLVAANVARDVRLPTRQERGARSLGVPDFLTVHSLATTTGDDPALDGLLLRHMVIQATRRGGVLALRCRGINRDDCTITYWDEKRDTYRTRPSTPDHLDALVAHALERGPRVPAPADAPEELRRTGIPNLSPNDAVFYYRPKDRYGQLHPWADVRAYWRARLASASGRAHRCPAVADVWPMTWRGWPATRGGCPLHDDRAHCLLAATRRELTAALTDPATVRELLMAVEADPATSADEVWALRDAGRDLYTPALDAVSRLLPPDHHLVDLHAGMVAADGSWLRTVDGQRVIVPTSMRKALARQRTASTMCNGPGDWPLLTVFGEVPVRRP